MTNEELYHEKQLLLRIADGDELAFRQIFQRYGDMIHANIYAIIKLDAIAQDLVQDTFLRVWLYRDKLPELENFRQWVLRISYNRAFTYLRDKATQARNIHRYADIITLADADNETEASVILSGLRKVISDIVQQMPPQQKKIYQLSREQGLKIPEIANMLNLSPNTVKNTLVKALHTLREGMQKAGFGMLLLGVLKIL